MILLEPAHKILHLNVEIKRRTISVTPFSRSSLRTRALCSNRTLEERVQNIGNLVMGVTTRSIVLIDRGLIPMHDLDFSRGRNCIPDNPPDTLDPSWLRSRATGL